MTKFWDAGALIFYCGLIFSQSAQATLPLPDLFSFQDKILHAGAFFVMSLLAWRCFRHWLKRPLLLLFVSASFCSIYGATDEWHQSFVAGRHSDSFDWIADTLGAILAMVMLYRFKLKNNKNQ